MSTFDELVASRQRWISEVLQPWCQAASLADLKKAAAEWGAIAGRVDTDATLWTWAWSRFPDLVHDEICERNPDMTALTTRPELAALQQEVRFRAILADLGLGSR